MDKGPDVLLRDREEGAPGGDHGDAARRRGRVLRGRVRRGARQRDDHPRGQADPSEAVQDAVREPRPGAQGGDPRGPGQPHRRGLRVLRQARQAEGRPGDVRDSAPRRCHSRHGQGAGAPCQEGCRRQDREVVPGGRGAVLREDARRGPRAPAHSLSFSSSLSSGFATFEITHSAGLRPFTVFTVTTMLPSVTVSPRCGTRFSL